MNFGYIGVSDKEIIKSYKIDGDDLIVSYIDGSQKKFYATKLAEENVVKRMFEQALQRDESFRRKKYYKGREIALRNLCLSSCYTLLLFALTSYNYTKYNHPVEHGIFTTIACLTAGTALYNAYEVCKENKREDELKKYRLLLSLAKEYEQIKTSEGIKTEDDKVLSINNIDKLSLKEVQRIKRNLTYKSRS